MDNKLQIVKQLPTGEIFSQLFCIKYFCDSANTSRKPQPRLIKQVVEALQKGGIIIYPTDTVYGLGCDILQQKR